MNLQHPRGLRFHARRDTPQRKRGAGVSQHKPGKTYHYTSKGRFMAKGLVAQIRSVWAASHIFQPGRSRFLTKRDARDMLRAAGLGATSARISEHTPITSFRTFEAYKAVSADFARFAASKGVLNVRDLRAEHARDFLLAKLEVGASCNTIRTIAAALAKLDTAMKSTPKRMGIPLEACLRPGIEAVRPVFNANAPKLDLETRAYVAPARLVDHVRNDAHRLAARLQLVAGFRVSEVMGLNRASFIGEAYDTILMRPCGIISVKGKGGYRRTQFVPLDDYKAVQAHIARHGKLVIAYRSYLASLRCACAEAGEAWNGSHALRHNHIREFIALAATTGTLNSGGIMREAMERVGHHRVSELATYCR